MADFSKKSFFFIFLVVSVLLDMTGRYKDKEQG